MQSRVPKTISIDIDLLNRLREEAEKQGEEKINTFIERCIKEGLDTIQNPENMSIPTMQKYLRRLNGYFDALEKKKQNKSKSDVKQPKTTTTPVSLEIEAE